MFFKSIVVISVTSLVLILGKVRFTNIRCEDLRPDFATITKCELKMIQRGVIALDIYIKLYQVAINNVTLRSALYKKASGFRPFLYDKTINFCDFMKNKKKYPFINIVMSPITNNSNINHTCPYDHDIILHNMILKDSMFEKLPLPGGEYMIQIKASAYNDPKTIVKAYFQQIENFAG